MSDRSSNMLNLMAQRSIINVTNRYAPLYFASTVCRYNIQVDMLGPNEIRANFHDPLRSANPLLVSDRLSVWRCRHRKLPDLGHFYKFQILSTRRNRPFFIYICGRSLQNEPKPSSACGRLGRRSEVRLRSCLHLRQLERPVRYPACEYTCNSRYCCQCEVQHLQEVRQVGRRCVRHTTHPNWPLAKWTRTHRDSAGLL